MKKTIERFIFRLKRFVLELGLRLQLGDIRFRLHQLQPHRSRLLHLSKRLRLRLRMSSPKRSRLIRRSSCALIWATTLLTQSIPCFLLPPIRFHLPFPILHLDRRSHLFGWHLRGRCLCSGADEV